MNYPKNQVVFWCVFVVFLILVGVVPIGCGSLKSGAVEVPVVPEAKAAAELDASNDTNRYLWLVGSAVGMPALLFSGVATGHYLIDPYLEGGIDLTGLGAVSFGMLGYFVYHAHFFELFFAEPTPPTERLTEQSPEYVEAYLAAFDVLPKLKHWDSYPLC